MIYFALLSPQKVIMAVATAGVMNSIVATVNGVQRFCPNE